MPASLSHRIPHILTPSGRAFSVGGRVQDPLPEQGQIRPSTLVGVPHPPILNTGNRGPIEHQPVTGRKVCQTCYPYAEGNGDSIPAAVQADRIKRLREALTVTLPPTLPSLPTAALDSPPQSSLVHIQHPHDCYLDSCRCRTLHSSALRSRDGTQCNTIYQTSTPPDIVQSPSLSPTSTASADLSVDEYIASPVSVYSTGSAKLYTNGDHPLHVHRNIWQLDGDESKALSSSLSPQNEISRV
ncbi:hypothetical protein BC826DRAFT_997618 [Russula brevipes]|nr:hypothetical protein BC826DRAFT_997618 [Russula brevipes]